MILVYKAVEGKIPIKVIDISQRKLVHNFRINVGKIELEGLFIEVLQNKMLFKQRGKDLHIIDVSNIFYALNVTQLKQKVASDFDSKNIKATRGNA